MTNVPNLSAPDFEFEFQPEFHPKIPEILPMEKMYTIQVGNKCYKISGASLSSDSPSYFTNYFSKPENETKTLFIDRSPIVFDRIILHLQGYFVEVATAMDFVYLFSDAFYYNLPRLKEFLYKSDIFVNIGSKSFKFSKKVINSKGNYPNFFSIAYNTIFRDPTTLISNMDLLRPPPQAPIVLVDRCHKLFEIILYYLQGYEVEVEDGVFRQKLLKECRYYRFLELEQRLIKVSIESNPFTLREEIVINHSNLKKKGLVIKNSNEPVLIEYSRPYVDENISRDLIMQIDSNEAFMIIKEGSRNVSIKFINETANYLIQLFDGFNGLKITKNDNQEIETSLVMNCAISSFTNIKVNEVEMKEGWFATLCNATNGEDIFLNLLKSQFKIEVKVDSLQLVGIKFHGITNHFNWNKRKQFI